jgi:AcrR family transcriptional regulator
VSGPALYRYFASRDELLADLVEDSYRDFHASLARADAEETPSDPRSRLRAIAIAYRGWALAQPHRYRLLFRAPVPGFRAHDDARVLAAQPAMNLLIDALSQSTTRADPAVPARLASQLEGWVIRQDRPQAKADVAQQAVSLWARLHGLVSLEIEGNIAAMGLDPQLFFATEISRLLQQVLT